MRNAKTSKIAAVRTCIPLERKSQITDMSIWPKKVSVRVQSFKQKPMDQRNATRIRLSRNTVHSLHQGSEYLKLIRNNFEFIFIQEQWISFRPSVHLTVFCFVSKGRCHRIRSLRETFLLFWYFS